MAKSVLVEVAKKAPDEILVNELFIGDHGKIRRRARSSAST